MELEIYENLTKNSTFDPESNFTLPINYYMEIPQVAIALLSAFANGLIITTIAVFPILHTRLYYYLSSWSICNFIITLSVPVTMNLLGITETMPGMVYCVWGEIGIVLMLGDLIFIGIISLDWYIFTFSAQSVCAGRCRRQQKLILATTWTLLGFLLTSTTVWCQVHFTVSISIWLYVFGYIAVFTLIIVLLCLRTLKLKTSSVVVEKRNLELKLIVAYLLCWLPNILGLFCFFLAFRGHCIHIEYLSFLISDSNACVFLILLYFNDRNFKVCIRKLLKLRAYDVADDSAREADNTLFIENYSIRD